MGAVLTKCIIALGMLLILFYLFSVLPEKVCGFKLRTVSERILYGFFAYFLIFEVAAVPLILTKRPFSLLFVLWMVVIAVVFLSSLYFILVKGCGRIALIPGKRPVFSIILIVFAVICIAALMAVSACEKYIGWDPSYYLGTMNTTLLTDTMYQYDGADGTPEKAINLRYALSAYYMHFTVICRLLSIPVRSMAWFVMRPLCVIMSGMAVFEIGKVVGDERTDRACQLVLLWAGVSFFWTGIHTTAYFMMVRGYEAKGYCANVILPMVVCCCISILKYAKRDNSLQWKKLALVCWASVPVSMSSMALVPACVMIFTLCFLIFVPAKALIIRRAVFCVIPNVFVMLVYLLYKKDIIEVVL